MSIIPLITSFLLLFSVPTTSDVGWSDTERSAMLAKVNDLRERGCYCGDNFMPPAGPVKWNDKLYTSAYRYAKHMDHHKFFGHQSKYAGNVGDRIDAVDYNWEVVGENLGDGQQTFDEVLRDWKYSESHCRMLMNPRVEDMAVARYKSLWVQHWGRELPPGTVPNDN